MFEMVKVKTGPHTEHPHTLLQNSSSDNKAKQQNACLRSTHNSL